MWLKNDWHCSMLVTSSLENGYQKMLFRAKNIFRFVIKTAIPFSHNSNVTVTINLNRQSEPLSQVRSRTVKALQRFPVFHIGFSICFPNFYN